MSCFSHHELFDLGKATPVTEHRSVAQDEQKTQRHASSRTDIGYCIQFFKESIYKKLNRSITLRKKFKTKFLDSNEFNHRNTFHAPLPIPVLQPDGTMSRFTYTNGFPKLSNQNYGIVRKPRRIADYETQRRANAAVQQISPVTLYGLVNNAGIGLGQPGIENHLDEIENMLK